METCWLSENRVLLEVNSLNPLCWNNQRSENRVSPIPTSTQNALYSTTDKSPDRWLDWMCDISFHPATASSISLASPWAGRINVQNSMIHGAPTAMGNYFDSISSPSVIRTEVFCPINPFLHHSSQLIHLTRVESPVWLAACPDTLFLPPLSTYSFNRVSSLRITGPE